MARTVEQRPCAGNCGRLKPANQYPLCHVCSRKARHGADCFARWRRQVNASQREAAARRRERRWRERFPGVPPEAARRIYQAGYNAGETHQRIRQRRAETI